MYKVNKKKIQGKIGKFNPIYLLLVLFKRNLFSRYLKRSKSMIIFLVIKPIVQVGIYTIIFSYLAKINVPNIPYVLIVLTGLLFWLPFVTIVLDVTTSLEKNASLIDKMYLPKNILFLSYMGSGLIEMIIIFLYVIIALYYMAIALSLKIFLIIIPIIIFYIFTYSLTSICSIIICFRKDFHHVIALFMQIYFFCTTILYNVDLIPNILKYIMFLNPLTGIIEFTRWCIFENYKLSFDLLVGSIMAIVILFFINKYIYKRYNIKVNEII